VDRNLRAKHEYHVASNAWHLSFLLCPQALPKPVPEACTDVPNFDRVAFHKLFHADVLAFFRANLGST